MLIVRSLRGRIVFFMSIISDAAIFQLPDAFSSEYLEAGGSSNTAGVKIQLEYNSLMTCQLLTSQL